MEYDLKYKFSIIIPLYNIRHDYFCDCLNSIYNQTFENFELIVVNDGSTNGCEKILENYYRTDIKLKLINQNNKGVSCARNVGIDNAEGEYLLFVDGDDWIETNLLENMNEIIDSYQGKCKLILFEHSQYDNEIGDRHYVKLITETEKRILIQRLMDENNWLNEKSNLNHMGAVWNKCYQKKYIVDNNIKFVPEIKYCEDVLYSIEALLKTDYIVYTNYQLYHYRLYGDSTFDRYNDNADIDFLSFIKKLRKLLISTGLYDTMYDAYIIKIYTSYQFVMILKFFNNKYKNKECAELWKKFNHIPQINEMISNINIESINLKGKLVVYFAKHDWYIFTKIIYKLKSNIRY